jgi:hypothetical protein
VVVLAGLVAALMLVLRRRRAPAASVDDVAPRIVPGVAGGVVDEPTLVEPATETTLPDLAPAPPVAVASVPPAPISSVPHVPPPASTSVPSAAAPSVATPPDEAAKPNLAANPWLRALAAAPADTTMSFISPFARIQPVAGEQSDAAETAKPPACPPTTGALFSPYAPADVDFGPGAGMGDGLDDAG